MKESRETATLLGHKFEYSSTNISTISTTRVEFKVYKRRWYVLFVFTAEAFIYNLTWNTWGPIQEPSKVAFGWTDFDLLLLSSWTAIALLATSLPLTWLMDSKGSYSSSVELDMEFELETLSW
jgi:FLVCR family MFS transporter